mmetsp:Transcript_58735/g.108388  ORF Transcript_58735/g.108388 Transcript_58735/m.108388 type:complete len:81 (+) Transcript_58735:369-611(+)
MATALAVAYGACLGACPDAMDAHEEDARERQASASAMHVRPGVEGFGENRGALQSLTTGLSAWVKVRAVAKRALVTAVAQ